MKIKIVILFSFLSLTTYQVKAQEITTWKQFLKDSVYNTDDKNYVSCNKILNKKRTSSLFYSLKNKKQILTTVYADTAFEEKEMFSPNLFKIVYDNFNEIFKLKKKLNHHFKSRTRHHNNFYDSIPSYTLIAIKYGDLHYNHFPKFTLEEMDDKKFKKVKKGMDVINKLYEIFEKLETN